MTEIKNHWENIYNFKCDQEVGWYQAIPDKSIELIEKYIPSKQDKYIDVGGGNSNLTKILCLKEYKNFTVLDISEAAIERCRAKLLRCKGIHNLTATNILEFDPNHQFLLWHDRAVFHFLTNIKEIKKYVAVASKSIAHNGILIISTSASTGPKKCSGLPLSRYSAHSLEKIFSDSFYLIESFEEIHITPQGIEQDYIWAVLKRN